MTSTRHFNAEIWDNAAFFICPVLVTHIFREFSDCCPACIASGNFILEFPSIRAPPNLSALVCGTVGQLVQQWLQYISSE